MKEQDVSTPIELIPHPDSKSIFELINVLPLDSKQLKISTVEDYPRELAIIYPNSAKIQATISSFYVTKTIYLSESSGEEIAIVSTPAVRYVGKGGVTFKNIPHTQINPDGNVNHSVKHTNGEISQIIAFIGFDTSISGMIFTKK